MRLGLSGGLGGGLSDGSRLSHDLGLNDSAGNVGAVETLLVAVPALPHAGSFPDTCVVGVCGSPSHVNGAGSTA